MPGDHGTVHVFYVDKSGRAVSEGFAFSLRNNVIAAARELGIRVSTIHGHRDPEYQDPKKLAAAVRKILAEDGTAIIIATEGTARTRAERKAGKYRSFTFASPMQEIVSDLENAVGGESAFQTLMHIAADKM